MPIHSVQCPNECRKKSVTKKMCVCVFVFVCVCLHIQASRPVGVGFCDGNHGPRRPLCLQRSLKRGRLHERPRGENFSRAGHHRNHPQSFSGHICLHLHLRHLRFSARGVGAVPQLVCALPPSSLSIYIPREFD